MGMKLNDAAVRNAKRLIKAGKVVSDSDWGDVNPSASEQTAFLEKHDWKAYGEWFLALDTDANAETKDHHNFPFGDFKKLHRDGLIAAKQRAAQFNYSAIEKAADDLLELLDKQSENGTK